MVRSHYKNSRTSRIVKKILYGSGGVRKRKEISEEKWLQEVIRDLNEESIRNYEDLAKMERHS